MYSKMMGKSPWVYEHIFAFGHLALCSLWNKYICIVFSDALF
jgi:hypothetical protein